MADRLAKEGGLMEQEDKQVYFSNEKTIIKTLIRKKWHQQHPSFNQSDSYYLLNRADQLILFRLRTGHNKLRAHMFGKLHIGNTDVCPCGKQSMTAEHLLQHCPLHQDCRRNVWPEETPLRVKLYGTREDLQRTDSFIRAIDIPI